MTRFQYIIVALLVLILCGIFLTTGIITYSFFYQSQSQANTQSDETEASSKQANELIPTPTTTPTPMITPITDFEIVARVFESDEFNISVNYPLGWVAKQNLEHQSILLVDDWVAFTEGDPETDATSVLISIVPEEANTSEEILENVTARLSNINKQIGSVSVDEYNGQRFVWGEYLAESLDDGMPAYYFITVITNGSRNVAAFAAVDPDRQNEVRLVYQTIVKSIKLD